MDIVQRLGGGVGGLKTSLVVVGLGSVIAILGLAYWGTRPEWVPLTRNGDPGEVGRIAERLEEEGISYRLEGRGTGVAVTEAELAKARVALARSGLPASGRPGFELFDQPSWGMTDFTQRINYRRALEGELERTISRMRGVESAQVHLGLQESAALRRSGGRAEASVVVALQGGLSPDRFLASGIASLVAGSVDGLEPGRVRILDDTGRLLTEVEDPDAPDALSDRQLRIRREFERHLEEKTEDLLAAVVGSGNLSVRVSAELDFDRVERTTRTVDGDRQATLQADRSEIVPGSEDQGAAQVITSTTFEPTRSVESIARNGTRVERLTVAVVVGHRAVRSPEGEVTDVPREPEEMVRIEELVARAVGLVPERGDGITVMNLPLVLPDAGQPVPLLAGPAPRGFLELLERFHRPALGLLGLLFAVGMGFSTLRRFSRISAPEALRDGSGQPALGPGQVDDPRQSRPGDPAAATVGAGGGVGASPPTKHPVVIENPELATRLVRSWMKET